MTAQDFNNFYNKSVTDAKSRYSSVFSKIKIGKITFPKNVKKNHVLYAGIAILLVGTFAVGRISAPNATFGLMDDREQAPTPLATQDLNKKFEFPLRSADGKEVARIEYVVESANLQDAFIYQGKMAKAVKGRTFLLFNLKITNPYSKTIEINTKDYLRVRLNGKDEQFAPELHNDPIQIQANSTKPARIGLPINDTDKDIVLMIGELDGEKQTINLNLSR